MGIVVKATADLDPQTWQEVAAVLAGHGFTVSDAFRQLLMHTAAGKELPFDCIIPNAETVAAMKELECGDLPTCNSFAGLMADRNNDEED